MEKDSLTVISLVHGADSARTSLDLPTFKSYGNQMQIMKDYYAVSGSDASQVGWVEVSAEDGTSGYLWYLKAEGETRARFTDYLEMTMLEAEKSAATVYHWFRR